jgi:hypothetical protein
MTEVNHALDERLEWVSAHLLAGPETHGIPDALIRRGREHKLDGPLS